MSRTARSLALPVSVRCIVGGLLLAASLPPWGWWPLAFVAIAVLDGLVADQPVWRRARRTWLFALVWLGVGMLWMWDLTAPGYVVASIVYAAYFAAAVAATPPGRGRLFALPAAVTLAEAARWAWPFGGVPLATIPQGQVSGPLAEVVRVAGPLLLVAVTVVGGQMLASLWRREWRPGGRGGLAVVATLLLAILAPTTQVVDELAIAVVQGGGPQRTRASPEDRVVVFNRHLEASEDIVDPVDLIVWPENVVHVDPSFVGSTEAELLGELARRHDATVVVGGVETVDDGRFNNAAFVIDPSGEVVDRYDKVRRVPFGEMVPLRSLIERFSGSVPGKDAIAGTEPAIVDTPVGPMSVAISWEVFFAGRVREGVQRGGQLVLNPTNGSSYWLTIVQSQQIASSRLRALESDRWVVQAAPTGFSAVIRPDGSIVERTAVSEREVIHATVEMREGSTWAIRLGDRIPIGVALVVVVAAWLVARRPDDHRADGNSAQGDSPEVDGA
ncbi:MAG: apolipoprotein N-acyltransferase [Acidimicrobiia bacterium]|nr:apolipoprotein N-acyltransferase [Acidimicrobiia bacterium]